MKLMTGLLAAYLVTMTLLCPSASMGADGKFKSDISLEPVTERWESFSTSGVFLKAADTGCEAQKKSCYASCEGLSSSCTGLLCTSPKGKCQSKCASIHC